MPNTGPSLSWVCIFLVMKKLRWRIVLSDALQILQRLFDAAARQVGQLRNIADRFKAGEHVGRGVREKRRGVEKIRAAEHVQHGIVLLGQAAPRRKARTFDSVVLSSCSKIESKERACCCPRRVIASGRRAANRMPAAGRQGNERYRRGSPSRRCAPGPPWSAPATPARRSGHNGALLKHGRRHRPSGRDCSGRRRRTGTFDNRRDA